MKKLSLVLSLVLLAVGTMLAQRTITGKVSDQNGEALIGATVFLPKVWTVLERVAHS